MLGVSHRYNISELSLLKASRMFLKRLPEAIIRRGEKVVVNFLPPLFL